jgi:Peptidase A4 family
MRIRKSLALAGLAGVSLIVPAMIGTATAVPAAQSASVSVKPPPTLLKLIHQPVISKKLVSRAAQAPGGITLFKSTNWAGYVALTGNSTTSFKAVTADFTVPSVNCSVVGTSDAFAYHWVGLDGWTDSTVEQDGVADFCEGGTAFYYAWWETFPGGINLTTALNPGDQVTATVTYTGGNYVMEVTDITQGTVVVNVTEPCNSGSTCHRSSAEAITEGYPSSPWVGTADYGRSLYNAVQVTNQAGTTGGIGSSTWKDGEVEAVNGSDITSLPARLYTTGTGTRMRSAFEISWKAVS